MYVKQGVAMSHANFGCFFDRQSLSVPDFFEIFASSIVIPKLRWRIETAYKRRRKHFQIIDCLPKIVAICTRTGKKNSP